MGRWIHSSSFLLLLVGCAALVQQPSAARAWESHAASASQTQPTEAPRQLVANGKILGESVAPKSGEICVVCNEPIGDNDAVYLVKGQRVPVHLIVCYHKLQAHPEVFLAQLQPKGAFLGAGGGEQKASYFWFLAGLYILVGLVFAALCAHQALQSGHSPVTWFGVGLVLNALGYLLLLTRPRGVVAALGGVPKGLHKIAATHAPQPCPGCGKMNHPSATECAGCGGRLQPVVESEVEKAQMDRG
jgi:hypothetical protein